MYYLFQGYRSEIHSAHHSTYPPLISDLNCSQDMLSPQISILCVYKEIVNPHYSQTPYLHICLLAKICKSITATLSRSFTDRHRAVKSSSCPWGHSQLRSNKVTFCPLDSAFLPTMCPFYRLLRATFAAFLCSLLEILLFKMPLRCSAEVFLCSKCRKAVVSYGKLCVR